MANLCRRAADRLSGEEIVDAKLDALSPEPIANRPVLRAFGIARTSEVLRARPGVGHTVVTILSIARGTRGGGGHSQAECPIIVGNALRRGPEVAMGATLLVIGARLAELTPALAGIVGRITNAVVSTSAAAAVTRLLFVGARRIVALGVGRGPGHVRVALDAGNTLTALQIADLPLFAIIKVAHAGLRLIVLIVGIRDALARLLIADLVLVAWGALLDPIGTSTQEKHGHGQQGHGSEKDEIVTRIETHDRASTITGRASILA